jgi:protoporphyrinogen oxidase
LFPGKLAQIFEQAEAMLSELDVFAAPPPVEQHVGLSESELDALAKELGLDGEILTMATKTGMYFNGRKWRLSTPLDLLGFKPLSIFNRIRLGLLVFQVRRIKNWRTIEGLTIRQWLEPICGKTVFNIVWDPLIKAKFSIYAEQVNAVWMWKKLMLRGGTRNEKGEEELMYFRGGFGKLIEGMVEAIESAGGLVTTKEEVMSVKVLDNNIVALHTSKDTVFGNQFLFTPAFPIIAKIFRDYSDQGWINKLIRPRYLGNICLVLRLKKSLSETYWLNVNDPGFPFVGVIEHTNFDLPKNYKGSHIVYLSRYIPVEDPAWDFSDVDYVEFCFENLKRMFPDFDKSWLIDYKIWRSEFAQPVTERNYSKYVPESETPFKNAFISTMAQIYPEDRGTNYAIREGKLIARKILNNLPR